MKNIPRIYCDAPLGVGVTVPITRDVAHYLTRVMRTDTCLVFGAGIEYTAKLGGDGQSLDVGAATDHPDPSGDVTMYFAPIKKTDDLMNMATQMGVAAFVPVMTDRTVAHHIHWDRMQKIVIEAAEQSGRNSVPKIYSPIKFSGLDMAGLAFGDERAAHGDLVGAARPGNRVLIGPEGGFSPAEFDALRAGGAIPVSLGKTILRAEVAAVVMMAMTGRGDA